MKASARSIQPFPLRMEADLKDKVRSLSASNRRSLNSELCVLIEEGMQWRQERAAVKA